MASFSSLNFIKKRIKKSVKQWISCRGSDGSWFQLKFIIEKFVDDDIIVDVIETMTDLQVKEVHRTQTRYELVSQDKSNRDIAIWGTYLLNGVEVSTNKLYIQKVKSKYDRDDIERFMKKIYGKSFVINDMQEYYR